jgi:hypothetical protein
VRRLLRAAGGRSRKLAGRADLFNDGTLSFGHHVEENERRKLDRNEAYNLKGNLRTICIRFCIYDFEMTPK